MKPLPRCLPLLAALVLAACSSAPGTPPPAPAPALLGDWLVDSVDQSPVGRQPEVRLSFGADGRLTGNAGCNPLMGRIEPKGGAALRIDNLATTRMMCPEPLMDQERRVLAALKGADSAAVDGDQLVLSGGGKPLLGATRAMAAKKKP